MLYLCIHVHNMNDERKGHSYWFGKLANLNTATTGPRGIAPHKPLMLLTVIDQKPLHFHSHARLRPEPAYFVWHREKHRI